jgi:pyruvate dehydrogenase E2 component (dihydrolipoamide acetyltransferase)
MATPIIMPRQGQTVESCIITKWHKNKGDKVEPGDILFTYETDKATFEEESQHSGILLDVFFEEGDDVPVLTNVCVIGQEGEDASQYSPHEAPDSLADEEEETPVVEEPQQEHPREEETHPSIGYKEHSEDQGILKISPRARNLAQKAGVDFSLARATGPEGRIIERDIIELIDKGPILTPAAF